MTSSKPSGGGAGEILSLAVPALGALLIEPLLLLADSAIVGHWSTDALAGLGLAQTVLATIVGVCIFLAYSTTARVARALGAGRLAEGLSAGVSAMWLGLFIGVGTLAAVVPLAGWIVGWFGAPDRVTAEGTSYLAVSAFGLPAMLVVQAATGVIRGLQDTKTPLYVAAGAAIVNVPLSIALTFAAQLGIVGAAVATVVCQWAMAGILAWVVARRTRGLGVNLRPSFAGVRDAWRDGVWLLLRTLCMRISLIALSVAALSLGTSQLAGHQIVWNIWGFLAAGLDALAIAAQALVGKFLGSGEHDQLRAASRKITRWGIVGGTVAAVLVAGVSWLLPGLFSPDPAVQSAVRAALIVVVIGQPLAGLDYVLDGVLMGAGDGRYLALASAVTFALFLPVLWLTMQVAPSGDAGLVAVWVTWAGWYMAVRAVTLVTRTRSDAWIR